MRYLYQYSSFITAGNDPNTPGTLADVQFDSDQYKLGYLAFIRLIGTVYFKKYSSGFQTQSPSEHFSKFKDKGLTVQEQHSKWLDDIRQTIWYRTKFENEMIASDEILMFHWKRSCWVLNMWKQADQNEMHLQPMTSFGWRITDGILKIEWDTESNIKNIRERVHVLTKGYKCTTGCSTNRCSCRKNEKKCSVGCECTNCTKSSQGDTHSTNTQEDTELSDLAIEEEPSTLPVDEIMNIIFGRSQDESRDMESTNVSDTEEPICTMNTAVDIQHSNEDMEVQ